LAWDPKRYLEFANQRARPVRELAARIPLDAPSLIYDLGCGPGNSAAVLAERWPAARIVGVDNSPEMLERARKEFPPGEWQLADLSSWRPERPAELLFANAAFQWVPEPEETARRLFSCVASGGAFAFQVPANLDGPPNDAIDRVLRELGYDSEIDAGKLSRHVLKPEAYYRALAFEAAAIDIWDTEYLQVLKGDDPVLSWIKGTALIPILAQLGQQRSPRFLERLAAELRVQYPQEPGGETLFPFRRRFVVALK
jgi:trans-aconitate 2-methyltransferase